MLEALLMVTLLCFQCDLQEQAYRDQLGYQTVARGVVSEQMAQHWDASAVAGADYFVMRPASGDAVYLRFIHSEQARDFQPMRQLGWSATEILARDPDQLAGQFAAEDSAFKVLVAPDYLSPKKNARAFQASGPANELLYFTHIQDPSKAYYDLGQAQSFVDRVFIMVLATDDLAASSDFYRQHFGMTVTDPIPYKISVLSKAWGMPADHLHSLALAPLPEKFMLEFDQYPPAAKPLEVAPGQLPAGVAMVSFVVDDLPDDTRLTLLAQPQALQQFPYDGRKTVTVLGAVGERIELIVR